MFKVLIVAFLALICHVFANIDATNFGAPADNHKTAFGGPIPASSGLADEGEQTLQLVDVAPQDESQQSVNHVKEMFSNAFKSIQVQREQAAAASQATPTN